MFLGKALILKGLAGVTALGSAITIGVVGNKNGWFGSSIDPALKELVAQVGLSNCKKTANTTECSIDSTGLKVKHDNTKEEGKTKSSGSGKIKVYKVASGYENNFKFVIEEGDITLAGGTGSTTITKLEQFETYEIKEETEGATKKWYFSRKKKAGENIKETLGLPEGCTLVDTVNCNEVEITTSNINKMKFDGVTTGNPQSSGDVKLTVTKVTPSDTDYPLDYKFELKGKDGQVTLNLGSKTITLRHNETTEFKIKGNSVSNLTLEKAWTAKNLGEKVGLVCPDPSGEKKCSFKDGSINVNNGNNGNGKIEGAKVKSPTGKKMTYEEDQSGHNQGFKFYLEGDEDITLTCNGSEDTNQEKKIEKKSGSNNTITYEIKKDSNDSKWYLTKKTTTGGSDG